jgi:hypothetical protein
MPRFHFHLRNDLDVPDEEGVELPHLEAARQEALSQARDLVGELVKEQGRIVLSHGIDIEDERGVVLATVRFADVLKIEA